MAPDARRRGASVVELLPRVEETRGRDRRAGKTEHRFKQNGCRKTDTGNSKDRGTQNAGIENMTSIDFIVARDDLQQCKSIETSLPEATQLPEEALLVKIDRFAFTANNITYAL